MARASLLHATLLFLATTAARAEPAAPQPGEQQSLDAFALAHKDCNVWSDGCMICRRLQAAAFACSTPGIACERTGLACQNPQRDETPAEASKPAQMPMPKEAH